MLKLGPVVIPTSMVTGLLALILGVFVFWKRSREEYFQEVEVLDLVIEALGWGLIGGRLVYILVNFGDFGINVWYWVGIWAHPGLAWPGMLVGGLVAYVRFCRQKRWNVFKSLDLAVIGLAMAQMWLSLGGFFSGTGMGRVTRFVGGVRFPELFEKRHPVSLYGAGVWLVVFGYLWWVEGRYRKFGWYQKSKGDARPGFLFFCYLVVFGVWGVISGLLSEPRWIVWGLDVSIGLKLLVGVIGALGLYARSGLSVKTGMDELWGNWQTEKEKRKKQKGKGFGR